MARGHDEPPLGCGLRDGLRRALGRTSVRQFPAGSGDRFARWLDRRPRAAGRRPATGRSFRRGESAMTTGTARLADRVARVALSPTMKGTIEAERLRREGADVVDL